MAGVDVAPLIGASFLLFIPDYVYLPNFDVCVLLGESESIDRRHYLMEFVLTAYLTVASTILTLSVGR